MRKLAHIERVTNIRPIEGADRIEQVNVLGWNVVIKKGEFKEGDLCVYIEIDSICPDKPEFEFLRDKKFKVKTIKLKGVISQGLILPLDILPSGNYEVGDDVTEILGITKYDDSEIISFPNRPVKKYKWFKRLWYKLFYKKNKKTSTFPSWVKKTDETRIQNIPHVLQDKSMFTVTEKVDGCSATYTLRKKLFGYEYLICSRNRVADKDSAYTEISDKYNIKKVLEGLFRHLRCKKHITIQGEIVGPKIQGNKYNLSQNDFYAFNLITDGRLCSSAFAESTLRYNEIKFVPILDYIFLPDTVDELVKMADGQSQLHNTLREGLVVRNGQTSFKVISINFLLKHKI